ncbi:hypothetical protein [Nonomuraea guangzhouensis]|uniref:Secreted protein n=1 Tax=Nonomuraea guangzhouensis TaxID=1291555 RepID=A0ABW4GVL3_9ACTN|nr:hypothetical protein [Nonomuraea guangzhouensis]
MRFVARLVMGSAIMAAMAVPIVPAVAAEGGQFSGPQSSSSDAGYFMNGWIGPFGSLAECQRSQREWDIEHVITDPCRYHPTGGGWWFAWA